MPCESLYGMSFDDRCVFVCVFAAPPSFSLSVPLSVPLFVSLGFNKQHFNPMLRLSQLTPFTLFPRHPQATAIGKTDVAKIEYMIRRAEKQLDTMRSSDVASVTVMRPRGGGQ